MKITDPGFKDFRTDASCLIRPQSLIGEKYVDCTPTQPRAPGTTPPPPLQTDPRRPARGRPVPAAAGEQRQDGRPRPGPEHPAPALPRPLPADPQRARRRPRGPRPGPRRGHRPRQPGAAPDRPGARILAQQNQQLASLASNGDAVLEPLARDRDPRHRLLPQRRDRGPGDRRAQRRPRGGPAASSPRPSIRSA